MPGSVLNALCVLSCLSSTKRLVRNAVCSYILQVRKLEIGEVVWPNGVAASGVAETVFYKHLYFKTF